MEIKILLADDDELLRNLVKEVLEEENYIVYAAEDGQQALELFYEKKDFSLVILDVMMPQIDGIAVLDDIRSISDVPILMLTALGDSSSELTGLRHGANDYVSKPFHYEVLLERIKNLLKMTKVQGLDIIKFERLVVDYAAHKVFVDGEEVILNNKEFQLLEYLVSNQGIVLSREKILDRVWGFDYEGDIRTIDTHIKMLRATLKEAGNYIKTVRGVGYSFEGKM
ncbi:MAG: response regulator transcription factor [Lachnospiraceae bacterium]|nr:response regulator transcription factor [Lachnospiraceae bacterium]